LLTTLGDTDRSTTEQVKKIILENNLKIKEAEMELVQLKKQKKGLSSTKEITQALSNQARQLANNIDSLSEKAKAEILHQLIQKITLTDEHAEIFLKIPKSEIKER
jgi:hypothetical protein